MHDGCFQQFVYASTEDTKKTNIITSHDNRINTLFVAVMVLRSKRKTNESPKLTSYKSKASFQHSIANIVRRKSYYQETYRSPKTRKKARKKQRNNVTPK